VGCHIQLVAINQVPDMDRFFPGPELFENMIEMKFRNFEIIASSVGALKS
jgi:hypothetical protein